MGLEIVQCWSCHHMTQHIGWGSSGAPEFQSYASKCFSITSNPQASDAYLDTAILYCLICNYWPMGLAQCRDYSGVTRLMPDPEDSRVYLKVVELRVIHCFEIEMHTCYLASCPLHICNWQIILSTLLYHAQHSTCGINHEIGWQATCDIAYQLNTSLIRHY